MTSYVKTETPGFPDEGHKFRRAMFGSFPRHSPYFRFKNVARELGKIVIAKLNERFPETVPPNGKWFSMRAFCNVALSGSRFCHYYPWVDEQELMSISLHLTYASLAYYQPSKGPFTAFAAAYIKRKIRSDPSVTRTEHRKPVRAYAVVKSAVDTLLEQGHKCPLSFSAVAKAAGVQESTARATMTFLAISVRGYESITNAEQWREPQDETPNDLLVRREVESARQRTIATLTKLVNELKPPNDRIMKLRYSSDPPLTFEQIAQELDYSPASIRKKHQRCLIAIKRSFHRLQKDAHGRKATKDQPEQLIQ